MSELSKAAMAAVNVLNKANEERFIQLQEYNKIFKWTCFYFSGSDVSDCCKATSQKVSRILDPRFGCETADEITDSVLTWSDFSITYKNYQRYIFPDYKPLFKETNTSEITFFPGSFISACEFLNASYKVESSSFITNELCAEWSAIVAGMVFLDKLDGFKKYAIEVYGIDKKIIETVSSKSLDGKVILNIDVYTKALLALQRFVGMNAEDLKKIHGGFYNKSCSFLDSEAKEKYLILDKEYKEEVVKMYELIKNVGELTLCWNEAKVADTFIEGDNVNAEVNINQFLNCCGEVIASDAGVANMVSDDFKDLKVIVSELTKRVAKVENTEELDAKIKKINITMIILIIVIVVLFIFTLSFSILISKKFLSFSKGSY